ncbi:hypothetical protein M758_1G329800, partial [Ceratodon purpureus]
MYSTCPLIQAPSLQADAQAKITARNIQRGTGRRKTRENRKSKDSFVGVPTQSVLLVLGKPGHLYTLSFEESFGSTTCRAQPIFWKITEQCACSHRICRVSLLFVVDVTAGSAFIGTGVTYGESSPILCCHSPIPSHSRPTFTRTEGLLGHLNLQHGILKSFLHNFLLLLLLCLLLLNIVLLA